MEKNIKIIKITNTDLTNKSQYNKRPYKKQYNQNYTPSPQPKPPQDFIQIYFLHLKK